VPVEQASRLGGDRVQAQISNTGFKALGKSKSGNCEKVI
jgi:hypothetical protein